MYKNYFCVRTCTNFFHECTCTETGRVFCTCIIFFGLQVSSFLVQAQKGMSYQLSELKQSGVEISSSADAVINQFGHTVEMGTVPLAPDFPSIVIWATIAFMFIGGIWFKYPDQK